MKRIKEVILFLKKNPLLTLIITYFAFRLPQLTLLPIFNDEAIYLDWGWRETHVPGFLYYSLYDAKQPFIMWLFGIFSNFFANPLFAGRFVSLLLGLLSTIGIYYTGKDLFNKKIGLLSALLYIFIPIFVLFDRQALLESAVICSNIWSFYFLNLVLSEKRIIKYEILTGVALGLGFLSKSTAALFLITTVVILLFYFIKTKKQTYLKRLVGITLTFVCIIILLLINPQFWQTLPSNSRYVMGISELLRFPFSLWTQNLSGILQIGFLFLTPLVFIFALYAIFYFIRKKTNLRLLIWIFVPLIIALLTLRGVSQRYIVGVLPLLVVLTSWAVITTDPFFKKVRFSLVILTLLIPFAISLLLIYNPLKYFLLSGNFTTFNEFGFVYGQTSGYGVQEAVNFLNLENGNSPIIVTYAENSGNPESAMSIFMNKNNIVNGYFEMKYLPGISPQAECIETSNGSPIFFISRDEQITGFEKFVKKIKTLTKPNGQETIGIYKFITGCKNPIKVNPIFHN
jgi:4-amino-4-deoxy-L-arabinose transferase-like glycosyltransferase